MDEFLVRAVVAGLAVAAVTGPMGCFVVWRRMAYFGDTLSHAALLGVALGLLAGLDVTIGIVAVCAAVAVLLAAQRDPHLAPDTWLGILAHSALALGLVVLTFMERVRMDLMGYLFGDILAVTRIDVAWVVGGGALALAGVVALWRPLLTATVSEEVAAVEGVPVARLRLAFVVLMAVVVAVAMKIVGALLITALLIIPAATARRFARTPEAMAVGAALCGAVAVVGGLGMSYVADTPSGPSIVVAAAALFSASLPVAWGRAA